MLKNTHAQLFSCVPLAAFRFAAKAMALTLALCCSVQSAELVMIEEAGCVYCAKFNAEIGPVYPKTKEGKLAPLRRIDLSEDWPADLSLVTPETITPTFILVENQREVGRLYGYQGDEFFWFLLGELLEKLEVETSDTNSTESTK